MQIKKLNVKLGGKKCLPPYKNNINMNLQRTSLRLLLLCIFITTVPATNFKIQSRIKREENAGQPRLLTSLIAPLFPQYYEVNYGEDVFNNLKSSETVTFFIVRDITAVRR